MKGKLEQQLRDGLSAQEAELQARARAFVDEVGAGHLGGTPDGFEGLVHSIEAEEGPISMAPSAGALPLTPEGESHNEGVFHDE